MLRRMYQRQLARVKRFLRRIETPTNDQVEYEDMFWAFFQNCWHLRDWIRNDGDAPQSLKEAADRTPADDLQLCADVANGSKHLKLGTPKHPEGWRGGNVRGDIKLFIGETVRSPSGETSVKSEWSYYITDNNGNEYPALDVAKRAVAEWERLIATNGGSLSE
jgi:hypothetical protein